MRRSVDKKPLNHFLPGTAVLSFGTAGCNLTCRFCQNWDISKARAFDRLQDRAAPDAIVAAALRAGCRSVASSMPPTSCPGVFEGRPGDWGRRRAPVAIGA